MIRTAVIVLVAALGCSGLAKIPPGTQLQSSTFGVKVSPQAPDGTPLVIGSHTTIITTPQPTDAGPNVNRFEGTAGLTGAKVKSTVATGPVGDELESAAPALGILHGQPPAPASIPPARPPVPAREAGITAGSS